MALVEDGRCEHLMLADECSHERCEEWRGRDCTPRLVEWVGAHWSNGNPCEMEVARDV